MSNSLEMILYHEYSITCPYNLMDEEVSKCISKSGSAVVFSNDKFSTGVHTISVHVDKVHLCIEYDLQSNSSCSVFKINNLVAFGVVDARYAQIRLVRSIGISGTLPIIIVNQTGIIIIDHPH